MRKWKYRVGALVAATAIATGGLVATSPAPAEASVRYTQKIYFWSLAWCLSSKKEIEDNWSGVGSGGTDPLVTNCRKEDSGKHKGEWYRIVAWS